MKTEVEVSPKDREVEVLATARRRRFTAEYKRRVLQEAEACSKPGELGALLRSEGLYSSHLSAWRVARSRGELAGLRPKKRGPQAPYSGGRYWVDELQRTGERTWHGPADLSARSVLPMLLYPPRPNPARESIQVKFRIENPENVRVRVFDIRGREVGILLDAVALPRGEHEVSWDGIDPQGGGVSGGCYFIRVEAGGEVGTSSVILLR